MTITYTSSSVLSFREVMFAFEDMITGSQAISQSSTEYVIEKNGQRTIFAGTDLEFTVINGNTFITGGTIQSTILTDTSGTVLGSLSDINLPAQTVTDALLAEATGTDPFALENLFFTEDLIINGIDGNDTTYDANENSEDGQPFGFTGNDIANLGNGNDFADLGAGPDKLRGDEGNDSLFGGQGRDNLKGGTGDDFLSGGLGNDVLRGQRGNDTLQGDEGNDRLFGNGGRDMLSGNTGEDILTGGNGNDTFEFISGDGNGTITDFNIGTETLTINGIEIFVDGAIDNETLSDGTEIIVTTLTDGYEISYGTGDFIFIESDIA